MPPILDAAQQAALVNPAFANYGTAYGFRMTEWLYGDRQSNPFWDQPDKWHTVGRVAFLDRAVTFTSVAAVAGGISGVSTQQVNLGGGKNVIVFARMATVINTTAPVGAPPTYTVLPNEQASYVDVQIQRQSGFIDVETAPIQNNFGFGFKPNIRPVPELWLGNETRQITVTNNSNNNVKVVFTFLLALLDTGR
jgi:hypothetical protein